MDTLPESMRKGIISYYEQSSPHYNNWGKDLEREGIYALHVGYTIPGQPTDHYEEVKRMTRHLINTSNIKDKEIVVDAGCGTGSLAFEIGVQFPQSIVYGINIVQHQLDIAEAFKVQHGVVNVHFLNQDYNRTTLPDQSIDKIIFAESLIHAHSKLALMQEMARIIKSSGTITIEDSFLLRETDVSEMEHRHQLEESWVLPPIIDIITMVEILHETGFTEIEVRDITENAFPSVRMAGENAAKRLVEQTDSDQRTLLNRVAMVANMELVRTGQIGYSIITAKRS